MNRFAFTLLLAIISLQSTAQYKYVPMPLDKGQWRYRTISTFKQNVVVQDYMLLGSNADTVIKGKTYKRILQREHVASGFKPFGVAIQSFAATAPDRTASFIREDDRKLYWYYISSTAPAKDTLIYDFSRGKNDTLPTVYNYSLGSADPVYVIRHVDTIDAQFSLRKRQIATNIYNPADTIVAIEGIGSNRGLIMNNYTGTYGQYELALEFHCFTEPTLSYNPYNIPCTYIWNSSTPVSVNTTEQPGIALYPNPFADVLSVETSRGAVLSICNGIGLEILRTELPAGHSRLATHSYPAGMYFISLHNESGQVIFTGSFLKN